MKAKIRDLIQTIGRTLISLEIEAKAADLESFMGKDLSVEIKPYREHRSLSQNSYYWTLITQVAAEVRMTTARLHNILLREHPRYWMASDSLVPVTLPDTDEAENRVLEDEKLHLIPTSQSDGEKRKYYLLRGSHTYDTAEMSVLLDDLIDRAKDLGINTLTPDELEKMRLYEQQKSKKRS